MDGERPAPGFEPPGRTKKENKEMPLIYDDKVCVYANELIAYDEGEKCGSENGFLNKNTFETLKRRRHIILLQRASKNREAIVDFDTMRKDIRQKYIEINGDPRALLAEERRQSVLEEAITFSAAATGFFERYRYEGGRCLPPEKIAEYAANVRVIEGVLALKRQHEEGSVGRGGRVKLWERLSEQVNGLLEVRDPKGNRLYPHTLPGKPATLKRKVCQYEAARKDGQEEAWLTLIHKGYGNRRASAVADEDMEAVLHKLVSLHNNLNSVQVMEEYNKVAEAMGMRKIKSPATIDRYKKKTALTTTSGRRGEKTFAGAYLKQVHRTAPDQAMTYWTLDGWTVELLYRKTVRRQEGGKECRFTTYTNRKTAVIVLDTCCNYPVGYAIGDHESPALIRQAVRNAVNHTTRLFGQRYRPLQIQSDKYQKKVMTPFFEAVARHYTPAARGNAKSKVIERYFGYLNTEYCQKQANWSGFGITSRTELQPNLEILNEMRQYVPDEETVTGQIRLIIEKEREKKAAAYLEAWSRTSPDRKLPMDDTDYLLAMGETTGRTNRITGNGLNMEICGRRLTYDSFDLSLREHYDEEWIVRYDPDDMGQVLVSNAVRKGMKDAGKEIGNLRYLLRQDRRVPMALADQDEDDFSYRKKVSDFNKSLRDMNAEKERATDERIRSIRQRIPGTVSGGLLDRYLLTDSRGRHKDNRSREREEAREAEFEELREEAGAPPAPAPRSQDDGEDYELDVRAFIDNDF